MTTAADARTKRALRAARDRVRDRLVDAAAALAADGVPRLELRGKLIRPLVAHALAPPGVRTGKVGDRFWPAVLAVQLAHEASLVHDDVIDGSRRRRGDATVVAARGTAAALVHGDHLLTAAYRAAVRSGDLAVVAHFARAVERTVAGERAQGACVGRAIGPDRYRAIARAKSGELFGYAAAVGARLAGDADRARRRRELGCRLGLAYQMLDDLLDYCPDAGTGKPAMRDHARGLWTWPLSELPASALARDADALVAAFFRQEPDRGGSSPARRALARLEAELDDLDRRVAAVSASTAAGSTGAALAAVVGNWRLAARRAVRREEASRGGGARPATAGTPRRRATRR